MEDNKIHGESEEVYKANHPDPQHNELLSNTPIKVRSGSVMSSGEVAGSGQDVGEMPTALDGLPENRLSGEVSEEQVREAALNSRPHSTATPRVRPERRDLVGGEAYTDTNWVEDGDGITDPATRDVDAKQPEYGAVHNDSSSPDYRDETYRYPDEKVRDPNSGYKPTTTPKENIAY